jgi:hypothetical protein
LIGALFASTTIALAHAEDTVVTGAWKLSVGVNDAPCSVTLLPNPDVSDAGPVSAATDCGQDFAAIGHWRTLGSRLELSSASGELIALLKPNGISFAGTRVADGRKIALDR